MNRFELEHIIKSCQKISDSNKLLVFGSQAIHGVANPPPDDLVISIEVDVFPMDNPEREIDIDAMIGEGSMFQDTHGYYAHGMNVYDTVLADGWQDRLKEINGIYNENVKAYSIGPEDLAISKLAAGREKDFDFVKKMIKYSFLDVEKTKELITSLSEKHQSKVRDNLKLCIPNEDSNIIAKNITHNKDSVNDKLPILNKDELDMDVRTVDVCNEILKLNNSNRNQLRNEIKIIIESFEKKGYLDYEGIAIRLLESPYLNKESNNLSRPENSPDFNKQYSIAKEAVIILHTEDYIKYNKFLNEIDEATKNRSENLISDISESLRTETVVNEILRLNNSSKNQFKAGMDYIINSNSKEGILNIEDIANELLLRNESNLEYKPELYNERYSIISDAICDLCEKGYLDYHNYKEVLPESSLTYFEEKEITTSEEVTINETVDQFNISKDIEELKEFFSKEDSKEQSNEIEIER